MAGATRGGARQRTRHGGGMSPAPNRGRLAHPNRPRPAPVAVVAVLALAGCPVGLFLNLAVSTPGRRADDGAHHEVGHRLLGTAPATCPFGSLSPGAGTRRHGRSAARLFRSCLPPISRPAPLAGSRAGRGIRLPGWRPTVRDWTSPSAPASPPTSGAGRPAGLAAARPPSHGARRGSCAPTIDRPVSQSRKNRLYAGWSRHAPSRPRSDDPTLSERA